MRIVFWIVLIGWIPAVVALYRRYPPRQVTLWALLAGLLFLPQGGIRLPVLDLDRVSATVIAITLGVLIFDGRRLAAFRPQWFDLPILLLIVSPFASSILNDIPNAAYDGFSATVEQFARWGMPYIIGRLYFSDAEGVRQLYRGFVLATVIYIPLVVFELRMSAVAHKWVYGQWATGNKPPRSGGILGLPNSRFVVFFDMAINAAAFMAMGGVLLFWAWWTKLLRKVFRVSTGLLALFVLLLVVLSRVVSGLMIYGACLTALAATRWTRMRIPIQVAAVLVFLYLGARLAGWDAQELIDTIGLVNQDFTLEARIRNASLVIDQTASSPIYGLAWGSRWRSEDVEAVDGLWVITYGSYGLLGVMALFGLMVIPAILVMGRCRTLRDPRELAAAGLAIVLVSFMVHNIFNAMLAPLLAAVAGGLAAHHPLAGPVGAPAEMAPADRSLAISGAAGPA